MNETRLTLAELAAESGLPARTIRYYIARGLLDGPEVAGRGAVYGERHLERLQEIRRLQSEGRMLAEIAQSDRTVELAEPQAMWTYTVADGVTVHVRADLAPWRLKQIRQAIAEMSSRLAEEKE
jgi:DNA-binding transcriptional MerR regulator